MQHEMNLGLNKRCSDLQKSQYFVLFIVFSWRLAIQMRFPREKRSFSHREVLFARKKFFSCEKSSFPYEKFFSHKKRSFSRAKSSNWFFPTLATPGGFLLHIRTFLLHFEMPSGGEMLLYFTLKNKSDLENIERDFLT